MDGPSYISNDNFANELEDELMKFTTTYDDPKVEDRNNADDQVDITECKRSCGNELVEETYCQHTTESSSSFVLREKCRAGRVIADNAATFSYLENLSLPLPNTASMAYPQDPPPPHFIMSESAAASHAKVVPDITGSENLARFADELKKVKDEVVDNQRVKQEINEFEVVRGQPIERPVVVMDGAVGSSDPLKEEPDLTQEGQTPSKVRSMAKVTAMAKTKGKRGRRKGGPRSSY